METDLGRQREILVGSSYRIIAVSKDRTGMIIPIQHYRPEHTFGNNIHPVDATWNKPLTISTIVIIDKNQSYYGLAIKTEAVSSWKVYWYNIDEIKKIGDNGVLFLPETSELPNLQ